MVGIGVNTGLSADDLPVDTATSVNLVSGRAIDRSDSRGDPGRADTELADWPGDTAAVADRYRPLCATLTRTVRVELPATARWRVSPSTSTTRAASWWRRPTARRGLSPPVTSRTCAFGGERQRYSTLRDPIARMRNRIGSPITRCITAVPMPVEISRDSSSGRITAAITSRPTIHA